MRFKFKAGDKVKLKKDVSFESFKRDMCDYRLWAKDVFRDIMTVTGNFHSDGWVSVTSPHSKIGGSYAVQPENLEPAKGASSHPLTSIFK
jgi:hypothetical protein